MLARSYSCFIQAQLLSTVSIYLVDNDLDYLYDYEHTLITEMEDGTLETKKALLYANIFY